MDERSTDRAPRDVVLDVLQPLGATEALSRALRAASLTAIPEDEERLSAFLSGELADELVGLIHPNSAERAISQIRALLVAPAESGLRTRPEPDGPITAPPPASGEIADLYSELSHKEVHTRPTPVWGMRAVKPGETPRDSTWILITTDQQLITMAEASVPRGIELVIATSLDVLTRALQRSLSGLSAVILDAAAPSIPVKRTLTVLTTHQGESRVIVWRMPHELRRRLIDAIPETRRWLTCDPEVTRPDLMRLVTL